MKPPIEFHIRMIDGRRQVSMKWGTVLNTDYKIPRPGITIEETFEDFKRHFPGVKIEVHDHTIQ